MNELLKSNGLIITSTVNCEFKIIETDILINNPATEYYIVAQKIDK